MALPPEHRTPRILALQAIVDSTPREKLIDFPLLEPRDHQMIGVFIQLYNYMDFNLRRAIETFAIAGLLQAEAAKAYPKIHSSKVATAVQDAVRTMPDDVENVAETVRILEIIERRREFRNLFSHWAARRITSEDAIVLLTKDETDAMRAGGSYLPSGGVKTCIIDLVNIRWVIDNELAPFELWLARKISEWRMRYVGD